MKILLIIIAALSILATVVVLSCVVMSGRKGPPS